MNSILKRFLPDPYVRFVVSFIGLYFFLYYFNILYIGITAKGGMYVPFLDKYLNYIDWWRTFSLGASAKILKWLDYSVLLNETQLRVVGRYGISLVYECLGYGIMSVFTSFCLTFPSPFKHRFLFMLAGLIVIQFLNIWRFILLVLYWNRSAPLFGMDHHDIFNIFIYTILIIGCYLWIRHSSKIKNAQNAA